MFPRTPATSADEVADFMAALGASIDYQVREVINGHGWGADETEECYLFYFDAQDTTNVPNITPIILAVDALDKIPEELFNIKWVLKFGQQLQFIIDPKSWDPMIGGPYAMLDVFAGYLEDQGCARAQTTDVIILWHAVQDIQDDYRHYEQPRVLFPRLAALANMTQLTLEQQIDAARRKIPLPVLSEMLDRNMQYGLTADMYPEPILEAV